MKNTTLLKPRIAQNNAFGKLGHCASIPANMNNLALFFILFLLCFPFRIFAQAPTGKEIAAAAANYLELKEFRKIDSLQGKKLIFTPVAVIDSNKRTNGFLLGIFENELAGIETGLKPGRYHLYFAHVNGKPHVYAESNGTIVKEAVRVSVTGFTDELYAKEKTVLYPKITFIPPGNQKSYAYSIFWGPIRLPGSSGSTISSSPTPSWSGLYGGTSSTSSYGCTYCGLTYGF